MPGQPSIDIHAHFYPMSYLKLVAEEGGAYGLSCDLNHPGGPLIDLAGKATSVIEERYHNIDARVAAMDKQNLDIHALSLTAPMVYWASAI